MGLFVLAETPAGYGLFKAKDKKLLSREDVATALDSAEAINSMLSLKKMIKFEDAAEALGEYTSLTEGKVTPMLQKLLDEIKDERKSSLAVCDPKLGAAINVLPELNLTPVSDSSTNDLFRAIKTYLPELFPDLQGDYLGNMALALSHSISRHKLKFSPDKVDVMIVNAISLMDNLDKELNNFFMRVKEWYGWHFPELDRIINDNVAYARIIMAMGMRTNAANTDLTEILPEDLVDRVKAAAEISMGTEIGDFDLENIRLLAEQALSFSDQRQQLSLYLAARMKAIAPNLTELVGELVGARLIAHAGSLLKLAKSPSSTIQILGAEKALFRALKTKHDTPKYGLIYHASLVGQATGKNKGKMARMLAAKAALGLRQDAFSDLSIEGIDGEDIAIDDEERADLGIKARAKLENALRRMEGKPLLAKSVQVGPNGSINPNKFEVNPSRSYNTDADAITEKTAKVSLIQEVEDTPMGSGSDSEDESEDEAEKAKRLAKEAKKAKKEKRKSGVSVAEAPDTPKASALSEADYERLAADAGISVSKFKRKFERGDVKLNADGTPMVLSKKELKKQRKSEVNQADSVDEEANSKKKRKHDDEEETPKKSKKKSKKEKA
ncbi:RNA-processing protein NOP58 [Apiospora kogelbergensis]|uniref:Nucleolar protein 58 n=1 Tax=Apiospora kogelbergensis TaxID=1337665 RepID=A0AAW0R953_9PEZI